MFRPESRPMDSRVSAKARPCHDSANTGSLRGGGCTEPQPLVPPMSAIPSMALLRRSYDERRTFIIVYGSACVRHPTWGGSVEHARQFAQGSHEAGYRGGSHTSADLTDTGAGMQDAGGHLRCYAQVDDL